MKNNHVFLSLLAIGLAAATFATLSNVVFPESLRGDKLLAAFYSVALLLFVVRDYARKPKSIGSKSAPLLRPTRPIFIDARHTTSHPTHRSALNRNVAA